MNDIRTLSTFVLRQIIIRILIRLLMIVIIMMILCDNMWYRNHPKVGVCKG